MPLSLSQYAQGEVKDFPRHFQMKWKIRAHENGEPFRFTLVTKGVEQEVEYIERGGGWGSLGDGNWYTTLVVCPVATLDTHEGTRIIHVDVDPEGHATYV